MNRRIAALALVAAAAAAGAAGTARIAAAEPARPPALAAVRVEERSGARVPLDLPFTEADGRRVRLGDFFGDGVPVLMILAYVRCQMLCSLVLHGAAAAVRAMPLELGRDYRVITVSIDPAEEASSARARRAQLLEEIGYPDQPDRWTYLVGAERPIRALADSLGFHYAWDARTEQYAHPAVLFALAPDGTITRYLHGIQFSPEELAAALRGAAGGQVSTASLADSVLSCFRFDPAARAHREQIDRYLRIGGAVLSLLLWERRRRRDA